MRYFDSVDSCQDVDAVGCENGDYGHVHVVEIGEIEKRGGICGREEVGTKRFGDNHGGDAEVHEVDDEEGDGGKGWYEDFVTPSKVEEVVDDAKKRNRLKGEDARKIRGELKKQY